jgi:hyperosmotically inducible periplasmic protein
MKKCLRIGYAGLLGLALLLAPAVIVVADSPDALISTKAKIKLLTADDVSVTDVNVDTRDGKVVLHGKVESEGEKSRAEAAIRKVDGVKEVQNLLQVVPKAEEKVVEASDERIEDAVEQKLKAKGLDEVDVKSVNNGVVLLAGETDTLPAQLSAIEAAREVPGVKRVASEIKTDSDR